MPTTRKGGIPLSFESFGLTQSADVELWLLPAQWGGVDVTLPVYACECVKITGSTQYVIWPAMRYGEAAVRLIGKILKAAGAEAAGTRWLARPDVFPLGMSKASGVTPSYYFSMDAATTGSVAAPEEFSDQFAREVFEASGVSDYAVFKAVWAALIGAMPRWLLKNMEPIDFGYFKVYALPYRANWKLNLLAAFPGLRSILSKIGPRKWQLVIPQLKEALFNSKNVELHQSEKGAHFGWTLEIVPSKHFTAFTASVESARRDSNPGEGYVRQWGAIVSKLQSHIEDVLFYACKKVAFPAATVNRSGQGGDQGFRVLTAAGTMRPEAVDRDDLPVVVDPDGDRVATPSGEAIEVGEVAVVPVLSFVRRNRGDLRKSGPVVSRRIRIKS